MPLPYVPGEGPLLDSVLAKLPEVNEEVIEAVREQLAEEARQYIPMAHEAMLDIIGDEEADLELRLDAGMVFVCHGLECKLDDPRVPPIMRLFLLQYKVTKH